MRDEYCDHATKQRRASGREQSKQSLKSKQGNETVTRLVILSSCGCHPRAAEVGDVGVGMARPAVEEAEEARSHGIVRWDLELGGRRVRPKSCLNLEPRRSGLNNFG